MLDDTCYFLPCNTNQHAKRLVALLNSNAARGFFDSFIFGDAKRPITAQLPATLDLCKSATEAGVSLSVWSGSSQLDFL